MAKAPDTSLLALIALKAVCCGGLLLALGGAGLGSVIASLAGNGWVQAGGVAVAALGTGWWLARWRRAKACANDGEAAAKLRGDVSEPERNSVPAE